ncbi:unnamed protein product (macronuclear) [Paramecium tetraurelia]|uniref:YTH domain-containing protein n=1 Tax=Paramecium tetraurelia TaxID=5888 RepID=A0BXT2_PARTE|nr:uncharacterized protein GSPATT00033202001 [Paramecium tetraurelia]CAK63349.1 unnamed protein product [Paramecium tetraurelia]|eukprot:XP_001430747.1 hypothetical protein (macronuclear) [Paramecium tetraurelia strain d4-2]
MKQHHKQRGYPIDEPVLQAVMSVAQLQNLYPKMADFNKAINLNSISKKAIFLILRSASLDNIHKGMKYGVWTSTPKSNARIDELFKESEDVYLIYSVVGTKAFQACAKLLGPFDPTASFLYWDEPLRWFGSFQIKCLFLNELKQKTLDEKQPAHLGSIVLTEQTDCTEITNGLGIFVLQCFKDQQEDETNVNVLLQQFQNMDRREEQIKQQRDLDQNFLTQQSHEQQLFEKSPFEYKNYHKRQNQQRWQSKQADQMMYMRAYYSANQQYAGSQYQGQNQQMYKNDNKQQYNNYDYQYYYPQQQQQYQQNNNQFKYGYDQQQYNQNPNYQRQPQKYQKKYYNNYQQNNYHQNNYQQNNYQQNNNYQGNNQKYQKHNDEQTVNNQDQQF